MMNYGFYNPMFNAQQRVNYMEQPQGLVTIPVTDIAEANAYRVDLNGTPTFFYNQSTKEIYLKRTNTQTGTADFEIFKIQETTPQLDKFQILTDKIEGLYALLEQKNKKGAKNED